MIKLSTGPSPYSFSLECLKKRSNYCGWGGETREVHRGDDDNGDDGARRRIITLKLQCPNFLKASHNQILLDKTELKNVLEREI